MEDHEVTRLRGLHDAAGRVLWAYDTAKRAERRAVTKAELAEASDAVAAAREAISAFLAA